MANPTKAERRAAWKKATTKTATALKKAGATYTPSKSGGGSRSVPLSATVVKPGEKESAIVKAATAGKTGVELTAAVSVPHSDVTSERIGSNVYKVTKPGYEDQYAYVTGEGDVRYTDSLHRAQAHEGFRVDHEPTPAELARQAMVTFKHKVDTTGRLEEKYIKAGEKAGTLVRVKPKPKAESVLLPSLLPVVKAEEPVHIPSPYVPGTQPEDVTYGERSKFDQPQVHEMVWGALKESRERIKDYKPLWSRVGDPLGLRERQLPITLPFYGKTEEQAEMAKKQIEWAPDAAEKAALTVAGGYGMGVVFRVGVKGVQYGFGKIAVGAEKFIPEKTKITIPQWLAKKRSGRYAEKGDPADVLSVQPFVRQSALMAGQAVEPVSGAMFGAAMVADVVTTPKEDHEQFKKIMDYTIGLYGAERGYKAPDKFIGMLRTRHMKRIDIKDIVEPDVLSGHKRYPEVKPGETFPEYVARYEKQMLPSEIQAGFRAWRGISDPARLPQPKGSKKFEFPTEKRHPSDMPGAYVSPDTASPYFLGIKKGTMSDALAADIPLFLKLFGKSPTRADILRLRAEGVRRIPKSELTSIKKAQRYIEKQADPEYFYTTKAMERKLAGVSGGKKEVEGVLPQRAIMKLTGKDYYTTIEGIRVPITEYRALKSNVIKTDISKSAKIVKDISKEITWGKLEAKYEPGYKGLIRSKPYVPVVGLELPKYYDPKYDPTKPYVYLSPYDPEYVPPPYKPPYKSPYTPPYVSPYETPYEATYKPPYKPPYETPYTPPYKPPYKPPYTPPYVPPYKPPYIPPPFIGAFLPLFDKQGKMTKKQKLAYLERKHLIGSPLTALKGMANEMGNAGSMFVKDKPGKLNTQFFGSDMFGGLLPKAVKKTRKGASKRKKQQTDIFNTF